LTADRVLFHALDPVISISAKNVLTPGSIGNRRLVLLTGHPLAQGAVTRRKLALAAVEGWRMICPPLRKEVQALVPGVPEYPRAEPPAGHRPVRVGQGRRGGRGAEEARHGRQPEPGAEHLPASLLPLVEVDLGGRDVTGGVAQGECEGMCGL
jgi:hypothetical protein